MNEMLDFEPAKIKPFRKVSLLHENFYEFKFIHSILADPYQIIVHIYYENNFRIKVSVSRYVITLNGWSKIEERKNVLYSFRISFPILSLGSDALLHAKSLAFLNMCDFSNCFFFLTKYLTNKSIPKNRFTSFFYEFSEIFIRRPNFNSILNFKQLKYLNQGYLRLNVTDKKISKLAKIDDETFVLSGHYISPFARSILNFEDFLDGLQLDCTFKVIKHYKTCLILGISHNTGIPLGFSFSKIEDANLYNSIFEIFYEITGFDLSKHTIESDQGKGLVASCSKYGCTHLKCLKHFITSLKNKKFSYEVGQLVKCNCQKDYDKLIEKFNENFESIEDQKELNELEKRLNKIGHSYKTKQISIADELLWEQVSMLRRIEHKMPSTTNNIESKHGHLNDITPRNNTFLGSINRLILSINTQIHQFNRNMNHNYKKVVNNTIKLSKNTYIKNKCEYYNSDLENQFDELIIDILPEFNVDECRETNFLKDLAVKNIRRFSHLKKKREEEIEKFFDDHFSSEFKEFALGYPIEIFDLISKGIKFFTEKNPK